MMKDGVKFLSAKKVAELANEVEARWPGADLVPNSVKNLAIVHEGEFVGFVDFVGEGCIDEC